MTLLFAPIDVVETQQYLSVLIIELHFTDNNSKSLYVEQKGFYGKFILKGNSKYYSGLHAGCPKFLSDFYQIGIFSIDISESHRY